jgi:hypothetical protein
MDTKKIEDVTRNAKLPINKLNIIKNTVNTNVINSLAPAEVDYRLCADPYLAKYGPDRRIDEIKKSVTLSANVCITEMVKHIYDESELLFRGTPNENDWWFWHDALSLMTAKETVLWMKENGYYSRWLLPELDLYQDYPEVKRRYDGRPIGDTPEGMPLDNNLNQDLHTDVERQVAATLMLGEDDERKFSTSTPNRLTDAYLRVWESVGPTPQRIVQDVLKVGPSWEDIWNNKGGYIQNVSRDGKRKAMLDDATIVTTTMETKNSRGGARKRILPQDNYGDTRLHSDAQNALSERLEKISTNTESRVENKMSH